jgi:hypothetical protein
MQPVFSQFFARKLRQIAILNHDASRRGTIEARNQIQDGRLAGAGTPEERDEFSGTHFQRDAIDGADESLTHAVMAAKIFAADRYGSVRSRNCGGCRHTG